MCTSILTLLLKPCSSAAAVKDAGQRWPRLQRTGRGNQGWNDGWEKAVGRVIRVNGSHKATSRDVRPRGMFTDVRWKQLSSGRCPPWRGARISPSRYGRHRSPRSSCRTLLTSTEGLVWKRGPANGGAITRSQSERCRGGVGTRLELLPRVYCSSDPICL